MSAIIQLPMLELYLHTSDQVYRCAKMTVLCPVDKYIYKAMHIENSLRFRQLLYTFL